jgi:hypothetical protein
VLRPGLGELGDPRAIDPPVALLSDPSSYFGSSPKRVGEI